MSDTHIVARDQLRAFIERIERLEEEKKTLADDIKDVYGEAKSMGFDTKILRKVISIRKIDADVRAEQEAILDTYLQALGMIQMDMFDEPEPETSPKLVATVATAMQTQAGRAALLTAVDIMIEREERIDPTTGEFLDDAPRSDAGLDIVTKHTEIATNEGGANQGEELAQGSTPDLEPSGPDVNGHPNSPEEANEVPAQDGEGTGLGESLSGKSDTARPASVDAQPNGRGSVGEAEESVVTVVGTESGTVVPSFLTKPPSPLRPHCQRPEMCAGVGRTHCHTCTKAMREQEELA
ncbi:Uncharacterized conserved protein, UPF0335 family [Ensifer sp. OV372]|nr:Uncharacterized conserved protein, UPF0335 family [Ensifer sp. OV372]